MKKVLEQLKHYAQNIDLSSRFEWEFDGTFLDSIPQIGKYINSTFQNSFKRNIELKLKLTEYFQKKPSDVDGLHFWIINDWGGIKNFKRTPKNIQKINNYRNEIKRGYLSRNSFSTISSLSKLSSFWDCRNYIIYDSRVIYALNWLILKWSQEKKYFPTPAGRNEIIANYDIDTIVRLFHIHSDQSKDLYYNYKEAYQRYCALIKDWSSQVWTDEYRKEYPFYLEMLLFCISDKEIFEDMKKSINIEIKR